MSYYTFDVYRFPCTFFSPFLLPLASYFLQLVLPHLSLSKFCLSFLGAFAKLRKYTISYVMSVRPSPVRPSVRMEKLDSHWTGFQEML